MESPVDYEIEEPLLMKNVQSPMLETDRGALSKAIYGTLILISSFKFQSRQNRENDEIKFDYEDVL